MTDGKGTNEYKYLSRNSRDWESTVGATRSGIPSAFRQSQTRLQLKGGVCALLPELDGPSRASPALPETEVLAGRSAPGASHSRGKHAGLVLN